MKSNIENRKKYVIDFLQSLPSNSRLIDIGAGLMPFKNYCNHLYYTSQDFGEYKGEGNVGLHVENFDSNNCDIISDITNIPVPDNSFDFVLCTEVFEHIPNPFLALKEMFRILKPSGKILLTTPFISFTHFAPYHFITGYNKYFFEFHQKTFNYKLVKCERSGDYASLIFQEIQRILSKNKIKLINPIIRALIKIVLFQVKKSSLNDIGCFQYFYVLQKK